MATSSSHCSRQNLWSHPWILSFSNTPHPICQWILSVLPLKYTQNLTTSYHHLVTTLVQAPMLSHWITTLASSMLFTFVLATLQSIPYPTLVRGFLLKCQVRSYHSAPNPPMAPFFFQSLYLGLQGLTWSDCWPPPGLLSYYYSLCPLLQTRWPLCCSLNLKSMPPLKSLLTYTSFCLECYSPS